MIVSRTVIFVHGFGGDKYARGMFTDIAEILDGCNLVFIDLNDYRDDGSLVINPMNKQVSILRSAHKKAVEDYPNAPVDLVCHSQGCVVAAMSGIEDVENILLITPPSELKFERIEEMFSSRKGAVVRKDGDSMLPRRAGSPTIVPKEYWRGIEDLDIPRLFNGLALSGSRILLVEAADDDVLKQTDFSTLHGEIEQRTLAGNHNFDGNSRPAFMDLVSAMTKSTPASCAQRTCS